MMEIFSGLDPLLKVLWLIALPVSLIFIVQSVMTFSGVDATDGLSADFDSNLDGADTPFQLFSLRNLINFLLGFSWGGISFFGTIHNKALLILTAVACGILFVAMFFFIIRQIQKLAENNSFDIGNTLNKTAEVYLAIPGHKSGRGKILISVKGSFRELDAMTENERIASGATVRVVKIESGDLLIVETL